MYSVIIPTRGRANQLLQCVNQLIKTTMSLLVEIIVVADEDDVLAQSAVKTLLPSFIKLITVPDSTAIAKWNIGLQHATGDYVVVGADDVWWRDGWLDACIKFGGDFIGLNTLEYNERHFTHFVMSRKYIVEQNGGVVFCPFYKAFFADNEVNERAKRAGVHRYCKAAVVEHNHPASGKAVTDETYSRANKYWGEDEIVFKSRKEQGFPNNFGGVWC